MTIKKYKQLISGDASQNSTNTVVLAPDEGLKCVAILPGLGFYENSSSDECSSDSEIESKQCRIDMLGRKIVKKVENQS